MMKFLKNLFRKKSKRDEVIEWCPDGITFKDKRDMNIFEGPVHSVAIKPGVYSVNNIAIFASDHISAIRTYFESEQNDNT